ncbi:unnamed protein product, partial [Meganyctiphanes norvegica]
METNDGETDEDRDCEIEKETEIQSSNDLGGSCFSQKGLQKAMNEDVILKELKEDPVQSQVVKAIDKEAIVYQCRLCDKAFAQNRFLKSHFKKSHLNTRNRVEHRCSHCDKTFKQNSYLIRHLTTHTGEKSYPCTVCNKEFSHKNSLLKHRRTHTGEKPYIC